MLRKIMSVFLLSCFLPAFLFSQNRQRLFDVGDEAYEWMQVLYLESSWTPPFPTQPASAEEILLFLKRVDYDSLSEHGKNAYRALEDELDSEGVFRLADSLSVQANMNGSLEGYFKFDADSVWKHGYEDRLSMASLPLEFWFLDFLYAKTDVAMKESHGMVHVPGNYTNLFSAERTFAELDWNVPLNTVVSLGSHHWNVLYGRHQMKWGSGTTGSLLVSDYPDYYDTLTAHLYWDFFKYTVSYIGMDAYTAGDEAESYFVDAYKAFYAHRFDVRILDVARISVTEAIMFGNRRPELRHFNPFFIFHNWFPDKYGNIGLLVEVALTPIEGLHLYGELVNTEIETELDGDGRPTSSGYLLGSLVSMPLRIGYLGANVEYVHTDPWLYNRDTNLTTYSYHRLARGNYPNPAEWIVKPFGYFLGPDTRMFFVGGSLRRPQSFSVELGLYHYVQGELSIDDEYLSLEDDYVDTPTGDPSSQNVLQLAVDVGHMPGIDIGFNLYMLWSDDQTDLLPAGGWDVQFAPYLSVDALALTETLGVLFQEPQ
ncbi:MAG: hypothetical protein KOO61_02215 [Spirochaetales bacterium]|nr:hypothetical protein [Spirochaetales bacterium]